MATHSTTYAADATAAMTRRNRSWCAPTEYSARYTVTVPNCIG